LRTYKEMKHTEGCKGETKTDTAYHSLKQNSKELCVVLLVPNRSMLKLIFSFISVHAGFRLLYLVISSSLMTCYTGSCIFEGENSILSVLLTFSFGF
jgi:hypothetical protein